MGKDDLRATKKEKERKKGRGKERERKPLAGTNLGVGRRSGVWWLRDPFALDAKQDA